MFFHQWDVFIGGGVVEKSRSISLNDFLNLLSIKDVADNRDNLQGGMRTPDLQVDKVKAALSSVEEQKHFRLKGCKLPAEFSSDRTSCSRHQNTLPLKFCSEPTQIHLDCVSPEEVLRLHLTELPNLRCATEQIGQRRNRLKRDTAFPAILKNPAILLSGRRRNSN